MKCQSCGFENPEESRFCGECGGKLQPLCAGCGQPVPDTFKFCNSCGHPVGDSKPGQAISEAEESEKASAQGVTEHAGPAPKPEQVRMEPKAPAEITGTPFLLKKDGTRLELAKDRVVIGRADICDLVLPSTGVSGQHARIEKTAEGYVIKDLGSTNGTFVNGMAITHQLLGHGDVITLGTEAFSFDEGGPDRPRASAPGDRLTQGKVRPTTVRPQVMKTRPVTRPVVQQPHPRVRPTAGTDVSAMAASAGGMLAAQAGRATGLTRSLTKTIQQRIQDRPKPPSAQAQDRPETSLVRRNIALYVFLTLITFGIWAIVWFFQVAGSLRELKPESNIRPGLDFLFTIISMGIYGLYLMYKYPKVIYQIEIERGLEAKDFSVISIVLVILQLGIIPWCMIQAHINNIIDAV